MTSTGVFRPQVTPGRRCRAAITLPLLLLSVLLCVVSAEAYVVSFDSGGGSEVAPYVDVQENALIAEPATPLRSGTTFLGWYRDPDLTVAWDFDVDVVTGDLTLYAGWQNTYRVRVVSGLTSASRAAPGERVYIRAYPADYWERFYRWISLVGDAHFEDSYDSRTSFIMPSRNVTVEARYLNRWDDNIIGIGGGCNTGSGTPIPLLLLLLLPPVALLSRMK